MHEFVEQLDFTANGHITRLCEAEDPNEYFSLFFTTTTASRYGTISVLECGVV